MKDDDLERLHDEHEAIADAAWENEYEQWCQEQDERAAETLNAPLRAIGDGTVYNPKDAYERR